MSYAGVAVVDYTLGLIGNKIQNSMTVAVKLWMLKYQKIAHIYWLLLKAIICYSLHRLIKYSLHLENCCLNMRLHVRLIS